jgi:hypothetical protein
MHILHIQSNLAPLLVTPNHKRESDPEQHSEPNPEQHQESETLIAALYQQGLRFSLHLTLISLFETLFFWKFVSETEDNALVKLVNSYAQGILNRCGNLTAPQQSVARNFVDLFINQTQTDAAGLAALTSRNSYNGTLLRTSWMYFGIITSLFISLTAIGQCNRIKTKWHWLIAENIALVSFLGLYEWMFFSTIVLNYQAISMPELDRMVVDEFMAQC